MTVSNFTCIVLLALRIDNFEQKLKFSQHTQAHALAHKERELLLVCARSRAHKERELLLVYIVR